MISQPELGKQLLLKRREKGMTQHELREKCHVSVRTIQRIESGAVTPRVSTIRILLEALEVDPKDWLGAGGPDTSMIKGIKDLLLIESSEETMKTVFSSAWISGIVFLFVNFLEISMEATMNIESSPISFIGTMIVVKVIQVISFILFTRGFIALGFLFENSLLKISSYLYIIAVCLISCLEIVELFVREEEVTGLLGLFSILLFGSVSIVFGNGLLRLQDGMGRIAKIAGRLEIAFGVSYLTVILSFIGVILLAPLIIVEIILLFKADQLVKEGSI